MLNRTEKSEGRSGGEEHFLKAFERKAGNFSENCR
jgi:hypothetical protein